MPENNGYHKSLFDTRDGVCWYCHRGPNTDRHEVFFGERNRDISKLAGTWLCLCPRCHAWVHAGVHISKDKTFDEYLKEKAEELFRNTYSADFTKIFYGSPKHWEIEQLKKEVKKRERK